MIKVIITLHAYFDNTTIIKTLNLINLDGFESNYR